LAFIAAFIFIVFWGWFYNGTMLREVFAQAAQTYGLFRPREETVSLFHWIIIGQAGLAIAFVGIYASGFASRGIAGGILLGILLEILAIGARCMIYATQPFPARLLALITLGGFIEMIGTGILVGAIYKSGATTAKS